MRIIIIAGPNGAGKTSFANRFLRSGSKPSPYLNADEIARRLAGPTGRTQDFDLAAGREMLDTLDGLVAERADFAFETTLATRTYAKRIPEWQKIGYRVGLNYIRLPSPEASMTRVGRRVAQGGHDIPRDAILRRFGKSLEYLETIYKPIVDEWFEWDSLEGTFAIRSRWDEK